MDQQMILISRPAIEQMLVSMQRAEGYCRHARSSYPFNSETDIYAEPTEFYSGASGYAGATLRRAIDTLEAHLTNN